MLERDVVPEVNEYVLLHGTKKETVDVIVNQGLDSRLSSSSYFGNGVYCAESSTKVDQYAGKNTCTSFNVKVILKLTSFIVKIMTVY